MTELNNIYKGHLGSKMKKIKVRFIVPNFEEEQQTQSKESFSGMLIVKNNDSINKC